MLAPWRDPAEASGAIALALRPVRGGPRGGGRCAPRRADLGHWTARVTDGLKKKVVSLAAGDGLDGPFAPLYFAGDAPAADARGRPRHDGLYVLRDAARPDGADADAKRTGLFWDDDGADREDAQDVEDDAYATTTTDAPVDPTSAATSFFERFGILPDDEPVRLPTCVRARNAANAAVPVFQDFAAYANVASNGAIRAAASRYQIDFDDLDQVQEDLLALADAYAET